MNPKAIFNLQLPGDVSHILQRGTTSCLQHLPAFCAFHDRKSNTTTPHVTHNYMARILTQPSRVKKESLSATFEESQDVACGGTRKQWLRVATLPHPHVACNAGGSVAMLSSGVRVRRHDESELLACQVVGEALCVSGSDVDGLQLYDMLND